MIENIEKKILCAFEELESRGDIVITAVSKEPLVEKVMLAIGCSIESLIFKDELSAIVNSLNVLVNNIKVDNKDFQTIIGVEKSELENILNKLHAAYQILNAENK